MDLTAYRFSVEWARIEPVEGQFFDDALDHYEAIVDQVPRSRPRAVVTFKHFTAPHWFAMRGGWLDDEAATVFARYCDRVMARFGDRMALGVTLNEPNLARLLSWIELPDIVRELERATLVAASEAAGVDRYRLANVMLPEEMDAMADGMTAGHLAAKEAIKGRRDDLPVGLSLAIVDDVADGDDPSVRDRKRARCTSAGWSLRATTTSWACRTTSGSTTTAPARCHFRQTYRPTRWGPPSSRSRSAGAVRYAYESAGVPVLVTEHA